MSTSERFVFRNRRRRNRRDESYRRPVVAAAAVWTAFPAAAVPASTALVPK
jgi:hypothetical protein